MASHAQQSAPIPAFDEMTQHNFIVWRACAPPELPRLRMPSRERGSSRRSRSGLLAHERLSRRNASNTGPLPHLERSCECSRGSLAPRKLTHARCSPWCCWAFGYSMTSSALARSVAGISSPSAFAVLRLISSSYRVGACTGRSAGFSPRRMRST